MTERIIHSALETLSREAKELYLGNAIPELFELPTALEFSRDFVAKNIPCVIRGATLNWPAVTKWNSHYFKKNFGDKEVTVAITPNGYADGVAVNRKDNKEYFVMPEDRQMTMAEFIEMMERKSPEIPYIQKQNSNLMTDFSELLDDIRKRDMEFALQTFNKEPDAINFWMGDERAITSMHKDPYENIYCVVSGHKDFILIPPVCYHNVKRRKFPSARYKTVNNVLEIDPILDDDGKTIEIDWVDVDPLNPDLKKCPEYAKALKYEVRINEGDILYLPSLWYHHVRQSHKCIAVNFWFDMDYDARYCYYKMVEELCSKTLK